MNRSRRNTRGHILLPAAIVAGVLSILVAGYLSWITNEYMLCQRSRAWTQSLYLCEAGVELGLAEVNFPYRLSGPSAAFKSANGWASGGAGLYTKTVTNFVDASGTTAGSFTIAVNVTTANPVVTATATCPTGTHGPSVTRAVKVVMKRGSQFPYGMVTKTALVTAGFNLTTDSFDSTDSTKSTGGLYDSSSGKKQPNGDIATTGGLVNLQVTGNTDIYGRLLLGSSLLSLQVLTLGTTVGATFVAGDRSSTVADGVAKGWIIDDYNIDIPDVSLPFDPATASNVGLAALLGGTLTSGDWKATAIVLAGNSKLTINGNVRLYVSTDISLLNNATIIISPGSKLEVYAGGLVTLLGGGVRNDTGQAANNQFYGLPLSLVWNVNGSNPWIGTIYAPSAAVTMLGVGANPDVSGGITVNSLVMAGNLRLHYDESLRKSVLTAAYSAAGWQSLVNRDGTWVMDTN